MQTIHLTCMPRLSLAALALLIFPSLASASAFPEQLIAAMDVLATDLVPGSIDTPSPSQADMFDAPAHLGGHYPLVGGSLAMMSTGNVNDTSVDFDWPGCGPDGSAGDHAILTFALEVPSWSFLRPGQL
jgi:hypothetical protein